MTRIAATTFLCAAFSFGVLLGLAIWVALGYSLGLWFDAPIAGLLCGLAYWGFDYAVSTAAAAQTAGRPYRGVHCSAVIACPLTSGFLFGCPLSGTTR